MKAMRPAHSFAAPAARILVLSAFVLLQIAAPVRAEERTIAIGTELDYPPYSFLGADGEPSGFNVEIAEAVADAVGMRVEIVMDTWERIRAALESGEIDAIVGMYYSESRDRIVDFTPPFVVVHQSAFARTDTPKISSEEELQEKALIVMTNDIMHDYVRENGIGSSLIEAGTQAEALRVLSTGRGEYALVARLPGLYWTRELDLSNVVEAGPPFHPSDYCFAVADGDVELLSSLSEGLAVIEETGTYGNLYRSWLGILEPSYLAQQRARRLAVYVAVPIIVVLIALFVWNAMLRRRVESRTKLLNERSEQRRELTETLDRTNRLLAAVRNIDRLITHERSGRTLLERTCTYLTENMGFYRAWAVMVDAAGNAEHVVQSGLPPERFASLRTRIFASQYPECLTKAVTVGGAVVMRNPVEECASCPMRENCYDRSALAVGMTHKQTLYGVLSVSTPKHAVLSEEEVRILDDVADDLGFALHGLKLEQDRAVIVASLARASRIVEKSPLMLFRWDPEPAWPVQYVSANVSQLGYKSSDFTDGRLSYRFIIHPEDRADVETEVRHHTDRGDDAFVQMYRIIRSDGSAIWVEDRTHVQRNRAGEVTAYEGIITDISERVEHESAMRTRLRYEQCLSAISSELLAESSAGTRTVLAEALRHLQRASGADRVYVFVNRTNAEGELCMSQIAEFCAEGIEPQIDNPALACLPYSAGYSRWRREMEAGNPVHGPVGSFPPQERETLEDQNIQALLVLPISYGGRFRGFIGFDSVKTDKTWDDADISLLETAAGMIGTYLRKTEADETLRESEARYRTLFDLESDAIFLIRDEDGAIMEANEAAEAMYGFEREQFVGMSFDALSSTPPNAGGDNLNLEPLQNHVTSDGHVFPVEISTRGFRLGGTGVHVAAVRDISERLRREQERVNFEKRLVLTQKRESLGAMAGAIAHHYNNLLTSVIGGLQLARSDDTSNESTEQYLAMAEDAARRGTDLGKSMLTYLGQSSGTKTMVDLSGQTREMAPILEASVSSDVTIRFDLAEGLPSAEVDADAFRQVILNLVTNGEEAIATSGTIDIRTGIRRVDETTEITDADGTLVATGEYVYLSVTDNGSGMTDDVRQRMFDPFFTTKFTGRGLGLAAVRGIVQAHHGAVLVDTVRGRGTEVTVLVPVRPIAPA